MPAACPKGGGVVSKPVFSAMSPRALRVIWLTLIGKPAWLLGAARADFACRVMRCIELGAAIP